MNDKKSEISSDVSLDSQYTELPFELNKQVRGIVHEAQKTIYTLLLDVVKRKHPAFVLSLFKDLFIHLVYDANSIPSQAIHKIVSVNNEEEFKNTIKRACYILINNWEAARQYQAIRDLIAVFNDSEIYQKTPFVKFARVKKWLHNFINSKDYEDLRIYALKHEDKEKVHWSYRYTSYLLVSQYANRSNPIEQRKAARGLAKELKEKFKFDLAMYAARANSRVAKESNLNNPTGLGDEIINLIKIIVAKRGKFNYVNLANIFLQQTQNLTYQEFKLSLNNYLAFSMGDLDLLNLVKAKIDEKLQPLYDKYDWEPVTKLLLQKTCDRLVEYLTTENNQSPSELFLLLIFQKTPLMLVILLLKIVLISQPSRLRLEECIANLISYYEKLPEEECKWIINFVDIFNIAFAIYAENVEYNLIKMSNDGAEDKSMAEWEDYRVFSQIKRQSSSEFSLPSEQE